MKSTRSKLIEEHYKKLRYKPETKKEGWLASDFGRGESESATTILVDTGSKTVINITQHDTQPIIINIDKILPEYFHEKLLESVTQEALKEVENSIFNKVRQEVLEDLNQALSVAQNQPPKLKNWKQKAMQIKNRA